MFHAGKIRVFCGLQRFTTVYNGLQIAELLRGILATALQPLALFWCGAHTPCGGGVGGRTAERTALVVGEHEVTARLALGTVDGWSGGEIVGCGGKLVR